MFGAFGDVKRRQPVFTFKRGAVFSAFGDHSNRPTQQLQQKQPVGFQASQLYISPSSSNSTADSEDPFEFPIITDMPPENITTNKSVKPGSKKEKDKTNKEKSNKEDDDSIFDFPNSLEEFSEVKLMVASTRTVPEMPKLTRKRSKPKMKAKSAPSTPKTSATAKKKDTPIVAKSESTINTMKKRVVCLDRKPTRSSPNEPHDTSNTPSRSQTLGRNRAMLPNLNCVPVANTENAFDIFAFDPSPPSQLPYNNTTQFTHHVSTHIANNSYNPHINTPSSHPVYTTGYSHNGIHPSNFTRFNHSSPINNSSVLRTRNMDLRSTTSNWHHPVSIDGLLNDSTPVESQSNFSHTSSAQTLMQHQQQQKSSSSVDQMKPVEKKRKRNLVAHLKSANGEKESTPVHNRGFDFFSDEDDLTEQQEQNDLLPLCEFITKSNKERSLSPELTYAERMELELDTMMHSEFGINDQQTPDKPKKDEAQHRRHYQPLNKMNVRVTFQKK